MMIEDEISRLWEKDFSKIWKDEAKLTKVTFKGFGRSMPLVVIHNSIRDYWEKTKESKSKDIDEKNNGCEFDSGRIEKYAGYFTKYQGMYVWINNNPSLVEHIIIVSPEHREHPIAEEHISMMELTDETDYAIYLNLRGSGAGIPHHLHYQGQKRGHFPLLNKAYSKRNPKDRKELLNYVHYNASSFTDPIFRIVFECNSDIGRWPVADMLVNLHDRLKCRGMSYNLIFDRRKVMMFPRSSEFVNDITPELKEAGMDKWRLAGQEMGLLFTAKYKSIVDCLAGKICIPEKKNTIYNRPKYDALISLLRGVTLTDRRQQENIEAMVRGFDSTF